MRPTKYLYKLEKSALYRTKSFRELASSCLRTSDAMAIQKNLSYCTINLLNLISNFNKSYYLSCLRGTRTISKIKVLHSSSLTDDNDYLGIIILKLKPKAKKRIDGTWDKKAEPSRYELVHLRDAFDAVSCSKLQTIDYINGLGFRVFSDLPVFRNFYAHRNKSTEKSAQNTLPIYLIPPDSHPNIALLEKPHSRSSPLIIDWIDEVEYAICELCN